MARRNNNGTSSNKRRRVTRSTTCSSSSDTSSSQASVVVVVQPKVEEVVVQPKLEEEIKTNVEEEIKPDEIVSGSNNNTMTPLAVAVEQSVPVFDKITKLLLVDMQSNTAEKVVDALDVLSDMMDPKNGKHDSSKNHKKKKKQKKNENNSDPDHDATTKDEEDHSSSSNNNSSSNDNSNNNRNSKRNNKRKRLTPEQHCKEAYRLGAPALIILLMQKWRENEEILMLSCCCLHMLAFDNDIGARRSIAKCGGMEAIVNAMKNFPRSEQLQTRACIALQNIISGISSEPSPILFASRRFMDQEIRVVLQAMEEFPEQPGLQEAACGLFTNLAVDETYRKKMIEAGVLSAVADILRGDNDDDSVIECVTDCMRQLIPKKDTTSCHSMIMDPERYNEGIMLVLRAMNEYPEQARVQEAACGIFASLAADETYRKNMLKAGALVAVVDILRGGNSDDAGVVECVTDCIRQLIHKDTNNNNEEETTDPDDDASSGHNAADATCPV